MLLKKHTTGSTWESISLKELDPVGIKEVKKCFEKPNNALRVFSNTKEKKQQWYEEVIESQQNLNFQEQYMVSFAHFPNGQALLCSQKEGATTRRTTQAPTTLLGTYLHSATPKYAPF